MLLLLLLCIWPQDSLQQMPPLDPANLLPLEAANGPDLDGSQGSTALDLMDRELGDQRSLGLEENQIDKLEVEQLEQRKEGIQSLMRRNLG